MLTAVLLFCALLTAPAAIAQSKAGVQESEIHLHKGRQKVLPIAGLERAAVGSDAIAEVHRMSEGQLLVTGLSPGTTTLLTWSKSGMRQRFLLVVDASN